MRRRLAFIAVTVLVVYWMALFTATHVPELPDVQSFENADKVAHTCGYAILAWMAAMVLRIAHWPVLRICVTVFAVCAIYGALDEWLQGFTRRHSDPWDWAADLVGTTIGLIIFLLTYKTIRRTYLRLTGQQERA